MDVFMLVKVLRACGSARGDGPAPPRPQLPAEGHLSGLSPAVLRRVTKARPGVLPTASLRGEI